MCKIYSISYDLDATNPDRQEIGYKPLHKAIRNSYPQSHSALESTWLVITDEDSDAIYNKLQGYFFEGEKILITEITNNYQSHGLSELSDISLEIFAKLFTYIR